ATASGRQEDLLSLSTTMQYAGPGFFLAPPAWGLPNHASASWSDVITVRSTEGAPLPDQIRLNFALGLASPYAPCHDHAYTVRANDLRLAPWQSGKFDSETDMMSTRTMHYFHLDLPVSASGVSDPLFLELSQEIGSILRSGLHYYDSAEATLSIQS